MITFNKLQFEVAKTKYITLCLEKAKDEQRFRIHYEPKSVKFPDYIKKKHIDQVYENIHSASDELISLSRQLMRLGIKHLVVFELKRGEF